LLEVDHAPILSESVHLLEINEDLTHMIPSTLLDERGIMQLNGTGSYPAREAEIPRLLIRSTCARAELSC
jgi:hypothetical protein